MIMIMIKMKMKRTDWIRKKCKIHKLFEIIVIEQLKHFFLILILFNNFFYDASYNLRKKKIVGDDYSCES